jgi:hypothetical protein
MPISIFQDLVTTGVAQIFSFFCKLLKFIAVKTIQAIMGSDPDKSASVLNGISYRPVREAFGYGILLNCDQIFLGEDGTGWKGKEQIKL